MGFSTAARVGAAIIAAAIWAAEALFFRELLDATGAVGIAAARLSSYMTDWINVLAALVCTAVAANARILTSPQWRLTAAAAITMLGVVWMAMAGWSTAFEQGVSSAITHVLAPSAVLGLWALILPHGGLRWSDAARAALFPLAYLVILFARGLAGDEYPYPWVDVPTVGWGAALGFAGLVVGVTLIVALVLVLLDRSLDRRRRPQG